MATWFVYGPIAIYQICICSNFDRDMAKLVNPSSPLFANIVYEWHTKARCRQIYGYINYIWTET